MQRLDYEGVHILLKQTVEKIIGDFVERERPRGTGTSPDEDLLFFPTEVMSGLVPEEGQRFSMALTKNELELITKTGDEETSSETDETDNRGILGKLQDATGFYEEGSFEDYLSRLRLEISVQPLEDPSSANIFVSLEVMPGKVLPFEDILIKIEEESDKDTRTWFHPICLSEGSDKAPFTFNTHTVAARSFDGRSLSHSYRPLK